MTLTVPPLIALKAVFAAVERTRPPEKVIVPLSLLSRLTPVPPVLGDRAGELDEAEGAGVAVRHLDRAAGGVGDRAGVAERAGAAVDVDRRRWSCPAIVAPEGTVTAAPTLVRLIPVPVPFLSRSLRVTVPPTLFSESAVPVVVVSVRVAPVSLRLIVPPPVAVKASLAPVIR